MGARQGAEILSFLRKWNDLRPKWAKNRESFVNASQTLFFFKSHFWPSYALQSALKRSPFNFGAKTANFTLIFTQWRKCSKICTNLYQNL
jgi:hypothetical protein